MIDWGIQARPKKAIVRRFLMQELGHRPNSVWLPSTGAECLRAALDANVVKAGDPLLLIERDDEVVPLVRAHQTKLGFDDATLFHGDIADAPVPKGCNYAYIDLMGSLSPGITEWLVNVVENRADDLVLDIAVSLNWRNNQFLREFEKAINIIAPGLVTQLSLDAALAKRGMVIPMALMSCAFRNFDVMFEKPIVYGDSRTTMLVFRVLDIRDGPNADYLWPSLKDVMMSSESAKKAWETRRAKAAETAKPTKPTRSNAAHKAWATRRANAAAKDAASRRSEGAKKAWATRRARAALTTVSPRSAAAHKSWVTRRANAGQAATF